MGTTRICGYEIDTDEKERPCLTALWILAGRPKNRTPAQFKRRKGVRKQLEFSADVWKSRRGFDAGTWAWCLIADDYANYLGLKMKPADEATTQETTRKTLKERLRETKEAVNNSFIPGTPEYEERLADNQQEAFAGGYDHNMGEEWKRGTEYDGTFVNRCAAFMTDLSDLSHLFFDLISLKGGDVILRGCVN